MAVVSRWVRCLFCLLLCFITLPVLAQDFVDLGSVAASSQFDALPDSEGRVHILGRRYQQLNVDGEELVSEAQGETTPGGALGFPPALSVAPDGSVHTVTRSGGSFTSGAQLRYRRRNAAGTWDRDYEFSTPTARNYVVGVAALSDEVVLTSTEIDNDVWGSLVVWSAQETSATNIGRISDLWRADDGARLRASTTRLFLAVGLPNPGGRMTVLSASDRAGLSSSSRSIHDSGSDRRGAPDLYVDTAGGAHVIYGTSQEVYYSAYDASGVRRAGDDVRVGESLGPWRLNVGMGAVAGEGEDVLVLLLRPGGNLAENSEVMWRRSTDGGATWSAGVDLGVTTNGAETRQRPRAMYVDGHFVALVAASDGIHMYTLEIDPDGDGDGFRAREDCDDMDDTSNPGADEICDDGADNDCDGDTDASDDDCSMADAGVADAGSDSDSGTVDSGVSGGDVGFARDSSLEDSGSVDSGPGGLMGGGCSCRATGGASPRGLAWFALGLVGILRRRRA